MGRFNQVLNAGKTFAQADKSKLLGQATGRAAGRMANTTAGQRVRAGIQNGRTAATGTAGKIKDRSLDAAINIAANPRVQKGAEMVGKTKAVGKIGVEKTAATAQKVVENTKDTIGLNKARKEHKYKVRENGKKKQADPRKLKFKPLDPTQINMKAVGRRKTDEFDLKAHYSGKYEQGTGTAGKAAQAHRNLNRAKTISRENFDLEGGWKTMAGASGVGAIAGGTAGAGLAAITGEDAWEGAKSGALYGAIGNTAVKGSRMAIGAGKGQKFGEAFNAFNSDTQMTKSVKSLHTLSKDAKLAQKTMYKKNGTL